MTNWIRAPRWIALRLVAVLVLAAAVASFAQSYRGLYLWAVHHGLSGFWAACWPLQVDTFIAVGELALFVALVDAWQRRQRAVAWAVTAVGLAVSVAGNVGHAPTHDLFARLTYAAPPVAAAAALFVGLVILKAVIGGQNKPESPAIVAAREVAIGRSGGRAYAASDRSRKADTTRAQKSDRERTERPPGRPRRTTRRRTGKRPQGGQREAAIAALLAGPDMTADDLTARFGVSGRTARRYRESARELAAAAANGDGPRT